MSIVPPRRHPSFQGMTAKRARGFATSQGKPRSMQHLTLRYLALSLSIAVGVCTTAYAGNAMPATDTPAVEHRVDATHAKLTLEQKVELMGGVDNFGIRAEQSIGLPELGMSDGPYGVRVGGDSTAYAAGI